MNFEIKLNDQEMGLVLEGLGALPLSRSREVDANVRRQAQEQFAAENPPADFPKAVAASGPSED